MLGPTLLWRTAVGDCGCDGFADAVVVEAASGVGDVD
jgi:hypothetical protein